MSLKSTILRNAVFNWLGLATIMIAGFIITPFLIDQLGKTNYGLWLLIASLTGYYGLLDLGMRGSVGRHIAFYRAKDDRPNVNVMFNTSLAILSSAGVIAIFATFVMVTFVLGLFDIPPDQVDASRIALLLVGISLALSLPLNTFDATLWGLQRNDIINAVDIVTVIVRTSLTYYYIGRGYGVLALAWITLLTTQGQGLAKALAIHHLEPSIRLGACYVTRVGAKKLFGFGVWAFVMSIARLLTSQLTTQIIGGRLGLASITPYSNANRLLTYGSQIVSTGAGVLSPIATGFHAGDETEKQRRLFLDGGKFCLAFSLFFTINFLLLGRGLVRRWLGADLEYAADLLIIIALGEFLPMGQLITTSIIVGVGKLRYTATLYILDGLGVFLSALLLSKPYGLTGICIGFATSAFVFRGVLMTICGARVVGVPVSRYILHAFLPAIATAAVPAAVLAGLVGMRTPETWAELFLYGGIFTCCYAVAMANLIGFDHVRAQIGSLNKRFAKV